MQNDFQELMKQATQFTQSGNLTAATAAIQTALQDSVRHTFIQANVTTNYISLPVQALNR